MNIGPPNAFRMRVQILEDQHHQNNQYELLFNRRFDFVSINSQCRWNGMPGVS